MLPLNGVIMLERASCPALLLLLAGSLCRGGRRRPVRVEKMGKGQVEKMHFDVSKSTSGGAYVV